MNILNVSRSQSRGYGLVELLVGFSMLSLLIVAYNQLLSNNWRQTHSMDKRMELIAGKKLVLGASCSKTLPLDTNLCPCQDLPLGKYSCPPNAYFSLKGDSGQTLMAATGALGTRYGSWDYRFSCSPTKFIAERARILDRTKAIPDFLEDPATKQKLSWAPLFPSGTPLCNEVFGNGSNANSCKQQVLAGSSVIVDDCAASDLRPNAKLPSETFCAVPFHKKIDFPSPFKSPPQVVVSFEAPAGGLCTSGSASPNPIIRLGASIPVTAGVGMLDPMTNTSMYLDGATYKPFGDTNNAGFDQLISRVSPTAPKTNSEFTIEAGASPQTNTCFGSHNYYFPVRVSWVAIGCQD